MEKETKVKSFTQQAVRRAIRKGYLLKYGLSDSKIFISLCPPLYSSPGPLDCYSKTTFKFEWGRTNTS